MVVADFRTVADLRGMDFHGNVQTADTSGSGHQRRDGSLHIVGEIPAVRARIGAELLFIEGLQVIQRLLGRIAEDAVRVALKRC